MWVLLLVMVVSVVALYWRTFSYPFTEWDDPLYITENKELAAFSWQQVTTQFSTFAAGNYHPVTMLSYSLEILLWGLDPQAMHRTNVLLHVINALLVFLFLHRLVGEPRIAALAALLFALHPMRVEAVVWIAARKDLLMMLFTQLCLIAWLGWIRRRKRRLYTAAWLLFALACLSKGMAVAIVPSLFLIDLLQGRSLKDRNIWIEKLPFIAGAIVTGLVVFVAQTDAKAISSLDAYWAQRMVAATANVMIYIGQQFIPAGLNAYYGYPEMSGAWLPLHYPLLACCTLAGLILWWRFRPSPLLTFCGLFFLANIALVLHFIPVGHALRADRYTYVSGIGWALFVVVIVQLLLARARAGRPAILVAVIVCYAGVLAVSTHRRIPVWSSALAVWNDILKEEPKAPSMYMSRGLTLQRMERLDEALADLDRSIAQSPPDQSIPRYHRGMLHLRMGHYEQAIADYQGILDLGESPPGVVPNMVYAKMELGRCEEVIADVNTHLDHVPGTVDLLNMRAWCLFKIGRGRDALADVRRSMEQDSTYGAIRYLDALADLARADTAAACAQLRGSARMPLANDTWRRHRDELRAQLCE